MANQSRSSNRSSRVISNINAAANHRAVRTTVKGIEKTAKWMATDHTNAAQRTSLMELEQSMNYILASMTLGNRRMGRLNDSVYRLINTGVGDSTLEIVVGWLIDHSLFIFDLLWGFIWPIVFYLLMTIFTVLMVVMFYVIFFYALFWFVFS
jgi:hypothetical protein